MIKSKSAVAIFAVAMLLLTMSASAQPLMAKLADTGPIKEVAFAKGPLTLKEVIPSAGALKLADFSAMADVDGQTYGAGTGKVAEIAANGAIGKTMSISINKVAGISKYTAGSLIVGNAEDNTIMKVDIASGQSQKLLDLKQLDTTGYPSGDVLKTGVLSSVASDGQAVYVGVQAGYSSSIFKIDPATGKIISQAWAPGPEPNIMTYRDGSLYVLDKSSMQIRRFDQDMKLTDAILDFGDANVRGIALRDDKIALLSPSDMTVKEAKLDAGVLMMAKPLDNRAIIRATDLVAAGAGLALIPRNVAVLICGDRAESGYDEFWNDVCWMYKTLIGMGYTKENIYVLYGNGNDYASANPAYQSSDKVTDFPAETVWVDKVFDGLKNGDTTNGIRKMRTNDNLLIWTFDHGAGGSPAYLCLMDGWMDEAHFASKLNAIPFAKRAIYMQQCRSGGFIDALQSPKTFISTACRSDQNAQRADTENENYGGRIYHHGEYNYYIISAMAGRTPTGSLVNPDTSGDGIVTALEVHNWETSHENLAEVPQMNDMGGVGSTFIIR